MASNNYTPTEQRIVTLLSDGKRHKRSEILEMCDELSADGAAYVHISNIRKKLPSGEDILCVFWQKSTWYQHVRLLNSPYDGRV